METDLEIRGRAAQLGAGIISGVSKRMVKQATECLAIRLAAVDQESHVPSRKEQNHGTS
jgi:carbon monoxide dehydrogenase subunit G